MAANREMPADNLPLPGEEGAAAGGVGAGAAAGGRPGVRLFDLKLALKLVVLVFLMGQDADQERLLMYSGAAVAFYIYQTGIIGAVFGFGGQRGAGNGGAGGGAGGDANGGGAGGAGAGGAGAMDHRLQTGPATFMQIPRDPGICTDLQWVVIGFALSLIPSWQPIGVPLPPAPAPAPEATEAEAAPGAPGAAEGGNGNGGNAEPIEVQ